MRGSATFHILPGNQRGAFALADAEAEAVAAPAPVQGFLVIPVTFVPMMLTYRQKLVSASAKYDFQSTSVRYTFDGLGIEQRGAT